MAKDATVVVTVRPLTAFLAEFLLAGFIWNSIILPRRNVNSFISASSISLLAKIKKVCYNKWGILPYTKAEVIYDSDMSEK